MHHDPETAYRLFLADQAADHARADHWRLARSVRHRCTARFGAVVRRRIGVLRRLAAWTWLTSIPRHSSAGPVLTPEASGCGSPC